MQEIIYLSDIKDKPVDWKGHKCDSEHLSESYFRLNNYGKAIRVSRCGSWLLFERYEDGRFRLIGAEFCKVRLCPMCSWRRSLKIFGQVSKVMDYITDKNGYRYIFLTLTVKNVPGKELSKTLDLLFASFKRFVERKEIRKMAKGWLRCLEVTHKWENGDDYHPHIHMVIAVNKSYFTSPMDYLSHDRLMILWRECVGIDYDPWVHIEKVRPVSIYGDGTLNYAKAVAEVAKYAVKPNDFILRPPNGKYLSAEHKKRLEEWANAETDKVVAVIDDALANRRLVAFGGEMRKAHKLLNLDSPEDGDLVFTDNEERVRLDLLAVIEKYNWHVGWKNYVLERIDE